MSEAIIPYQPNVGANAFFLAIFAVSFIAQLVLSSRYKTWSYLVGMGGGLILEIIGYAGRIQLHADPFSFNNFVQYVQSLHSAELMLKSDGKSVLIQKTDTSSV
jgi:hypothetical protein